MTERNYIKVVTSVLTVDKANSIANSIQTKVVVSTIQQPKTICNILQNSGIILYNNVDAEEVANALEKAKSVID